VNLAVVVVVAVVVVMVAVVVVMVAVAVVLMVAVVVGRSVFVHLWVEGVRFQVDLYTYRVADPRWNGGRMRTSDSILVMVIVVVVMGGRGWDGGDFRSVYLQRCRP
jgi:hypothetical protein